MVKIMKAFSKIVVLIIALVCIFVGLDKINHTYEIAEQRYTEYISELTESEEGLSEIPRFAEEYYVSTNVKEIITVYTCILAFGLLLILIMIIDFVKWVNTWEKEEE